MEILGLITARGGSKGLPGKNLRPLAGKPLVQWTVVAALDARSVSRLIISTDDRAIADVAQEAGAEVPFLRPAEHATDTSPHIDVIIHALDWLHMTESYVPDWLLLLQPTSPFRTADDIETAVRIAESTDCDAVIGVCESEHSPYLSYLMTDDHVLAPLLPQPAGYARRQDVGKTWRVNGALYLCRTGVILRERTLFPRITRAHIMPPERSVDIDTEYDFLYAEMLAARTERMTPTKCGGSTESTRD